MDREFIAERQKGLQAYLNFITQHHILSSCELVKKFLDTNNYSTNYTGKGHRFLVWMQCLYIHVYEMCVIGAEPSSFFSSEIALQQVSMFFRSDPKWEVVEPLKDIGKWC